MLVLSRKQNQTVVFPSCGIRIEILRTTGNNVLVGVEAPPEIHILRGELAALEAKPPKAGEYSLQDVHAMRNRMNQAKLAIKLLQKQLAVGKVEEAETSLEAALEAFGEMEKTLTTLPILKSTANAAEPNDIESPRLKRALIVEDDPNERALLASYLRACGYAVDTAEDGQAALEYLDLCKPDAVVMDMNMPRVNGHECVERIRRDDRFDDVKLFIVSGTDQQDANVATGDRGVQRWFQKPLQPEELINELKASLN